MVLNVSHTTSKKLYILLFSESRTYFFWENDFLVRAEAVPYASGVALPDSKEAGSSWFERILLADTNV